MVKPHENPRLFQAVKNTVSIWGSFFCDIVFPGRCVLCGEELLFQSEPFSLLCIRCTHSIRHIEGRRCRICSIKLLSEDDLCTRCKGTVFHFVSNYSLFEYNGAVKELIYQYKFMKRKRISLLFTRLIAEAYRRVYPGLTVVPVPPRRWILNKRGWDHIQVICTALERQYSIPISKCLKKIGGKSQKELDLKQRFDNIRGTIQLNRRGCGNRKVLLLDDIFTTGATVDECAVVLQRAGVEKVYVLSIAMEY